MRVAMGAPPEAIVIGSGQAEPFLAMRVIAPFPAPAAAA